MNKIGGIYEILNTVNGKRYIGSAVNLPRRIVRHKHDLRHGIHHNHHLQHAWGKYGGNTFEFNPVMVCFNPMELIPWEQRYIDEFRPEYNLSLTAGSIMGMVHTDDAKAKIAFAHLGKRKHTPESKAMIGAASRGRIPSLEVRAKMSASRLGVKRAPISEAHRLAISEAKMGKPVSASRLAQMHRRVLSPEVRAKISSALKGRAFSPEHRANLAAVNRRRAFEDRVIKGL